MIKKLLIASNNAHKLKEIKQILGDKIEQILTPGDLKIDADVVEDGDTFFANSLKKAKELSKLSGLTTLADDTGLVVEALGGEPGVHSARYAQAHNDELNNRKLLNNLSEEENRRAEFVTCVVLYYPSGEYIAATGKVGGKILREAKGSNGFGYDALFYCDALKKTFGECSEEEKNSVSHRAEALRLLMKRL